MSFWLKADFMYCYLLVIDSLYHESSWYIGIWNPHQVWCLLIQHEQAQLFTPASTWTHQPGDLSLVERLLQLEFIKVSLGAHKTIHMISTSGHTHLGAWFCSHFWLCHLCARTTCFKPIPCLRRLRSGVTCMEATWWAWYVIVISAVQYCTRQAIWSLSSGSHFYSQKLFMTMILCHGVGFGSCM